MIQKQNLEQILSINPESPLYTQRLRNGKGKFMLIASEANRAPKTRDIGSEEVGAVLTEKIKGYEKLQKIYQATRSTRLLESEVDQFNLDQFFRFQGLSCFEKISFHRRSRNDKDYLVQNLIDFFAEPSEVSFLYFSGHGHEKDGEWEIVSRNGHGYQTQLLDITEIANLWQGRNRKQQYLVIISDSCHSEKLIIKLKQNARLDDGSIMIQAACRHSQQAGDDDLGGFFTQDLLHTLRKNVYADLKLEIVGPSFQSPVFYSHFSQEQVRQKIEIPIGFNSINEMKDQKGRLMQNQILRMQAMQEQQQIKNKTTCQDCVEVQKKLVKQQKDLKGLSDLIRKYQINNQILLDQNKLMEKELEGIKKYVDSGDYMNNHQLARQQKYHDNKRRENMKLQPTDYFTLSKHLKHRQLNLMSDTRVQSESFVNQYILTEQSFDNQFSNYKIIIRLQSVFETNGGVMVGIAHKDLIQEQQFTKLKSYLQSGHGIYAVNSNGYSYNHCYPQFNNKPLGLWSFGEAGNEIEILVEMNKKKITFTRTDRADFQPFSMQFSTNNQDGPLHGFLYLNGDFIDIELLNL